MTTVPTAGDEERLVERATYMVGNPSAWDSYDEAASTVIRDLLADHARLRQERDDALRPRDMFVSALDAVNEWHTRLTLRAEAAEAALAASNAEAERLRAEVGDYIEKLQDKSAFQFGHTEAEHRGADEIKAVVVADLRYLLQGSAKQ